MNGFFGYLGRVQWHAAVVMGVLLLGLVGCQSESAGSDHGARATEDEIDFDRPSETKPTVVVKYKEDPPPLVLDGDVPPGAVADGYPPPFLPGAGWIEIGGGGGGGEDDEGNNFVTVEITVDEIPAPNISDISLLIVPSMNSEPAVATITASVSGSTSCKYIDEDRYGFINPESWQSVQAAFKSIRAVNCPSFVTPAAIGNWSTSWNTGDTFIIMWANTVGQLSSYTTAVVSH